jgi:CHASE2 domain-containing sensor protein
VGRQPKRKLVAAERPVSSSTMAKRPRFHSLKWVIVVLSITIPLLLWMDHRGSFDELEAIALDVSSDLGIVTRNTGVEIVDIDDSDYKELFQGQSPLNPAKLIELVDAIAKAKPKAIGIDIVTDPAVWTKIQAPSNIPIVWAYRPDNPEGTSPPPRNTTWGSPNWPVNGPVVRQYLRLVPCQESQCPSLGWEVMKKGFPNSGLEENSEELTIRFIRGQNVVHASHVLTLSNAANWGHPDSPLWNKTVLLGGTYNDAHETPLGRMSGVMIWANILETEIDGGGYRSPPWIVLLILGLVESIILVCLLQYWNFKRGLLISVVSVPFLSIALSWMVYHSAQRWAYFAMILVTLIAEQCIEVVRVQQNEQIGELFNDLRKGPRESG